jgi:oxalate decarboxylase
MIISRRPLLRTAATGVATAATANAQTSDIPQPERPGTDIGPRDVIRDRENPDVLVPLATDSGTLPNLKSPSRMLSEYSL